VGQQAPGIALERGRARRDRHAPARQPPQDRGGHGVEQREGVGEEPGPQAQQRFRCEQVLEQQPPGPRRLAPLAALQGGHEPVPVLLDTLGHDARLGAAGRVAGQQRRRGEPFVQVLADDAGAVDHEVAVDERRQGLEGIEVDEILGRTRGVGLDHAHLESLRREHDAHAVAVRIVAS